MNAGNLIFGLLIVGSFMAMFSMHRRGAHAHGGSSAHGGMGGGGCGGHGHGNGQHDDHADGPAHEHQVDKPLLGPPGTKSGDPAPAPAQDERHSGC